MYNDYVIWVILVFSVAGNILSVIRTKKKVELNQEEYTVLLHSLENILGDYMHILEPHIDILKTQYDTDPKSQTASIDAYNTKVDELLSKHAKLVIREHISDDLRRIATKYFSDKGIVLHILLQLKSQNNEE